MFTLLIIQSSKFYLVDQFLKLCFKSGPLPNVPNVALVMPFLFGLRIGVYMLYLLGDQHGAITSKMKTTIGTSQIGSSLWEIEITVLVPITNTRLTIYFSKFSYFVFITVKKKQW